MAPASRFLGSFTALTLMAFVLGCAGPVLPVLVDRTPPGEVGLLTSVNGDGAVQLFWSEPEDADFSFVQIIWKGTENYTTVNRGTTSYIFPGLPNGETITFLVKTADALGNQSSGKEVLGQPSADSQLDTSAPSEVLALTAAPADGRIFLNWNSPSEPDFAGVEVSYPENSQRFNPAKETTSLLITGLMNDFVYTFTVKTLDTLGNKSSGNRISAAPRAPDPSDLEPPSEVFGLQAAPGDSRITLYWSEPPVSDYAGVVISGDSLPGPIYIPTGTTNKLFTGLSNGVSYSFRVTAYDTSGNQAAGIEVSASPLPPGDTTPPSDVAFLRAEQADGQVTLSWVEPFDPDFAGVEIAYPGLSDPVFAAKGTTDSTLSGLSNGTDYLFTVRSRDENGNLSYGATISATPVAVIAEPAPDSPPVGSDPPPPAVPAPIPSDPPSDPPPAPDTTAPGEVTVLAAAAGDAQVTLSWSEPADGDFTGVEIGCTGLATPFFAAKGTTVKLVTGLVNGTSYSFTVRSKDASGNLSTGVQASATPVAVIAEPAPDSPPVAPAPIPSDPPSDPPPAPDTTAPGEVTALAAAAGDAQVTLSWSEPADGDFTGVEIGYPGLATPFFAAKGTTVKLVAGLVNGTSYSFTVRSKDATGNLSTGVQASATPQPPPPVTGNLSITATLSLPAAAAVTFTGTGSSLALSSSMNAGTGFAGASSYAWYVDGLLAGQASSLSLTGASLGLGLHGVTLVVVKSGVAYSGSFQLTVVN